jgi:hypothetical protein
MLRDTRVGLIEPMLNSAGTQPLALGTENYRTIDPQCLENPRPKGGTSTLAENVASPFQTEPGQKLKRRRPRMPSLGPGFLSPS